MVEINTEHLNERLNEFIRLFSLAPGIEIDLRPAISQSVQELHDSARFIRDRYYDANAILTGAAFLHSDLLANLILRVSGHLQASGLNSESHSLAKVNKALHGLDFFPTSRIPNVLKLVHPIGTVIGGVELHSYSVIYQGVSVGARIPNSEEDLYPVFEGPVILFARSAVFGNSRVGPNVVFGADSMIIDLEVPGNSLVVGRFPHHRILPGGGEVFRKFFTI
jgi:serine O-acetyltransferase